MYSTIFEQGSKHQSMHPVRYRRNTFCKMGGTVVKYNEFGYYQCNMISGEQEMVFETFSPEETENLGAAFAQRLHPGDVIAYWGDLGAGKTAFTRGVARGLGVTEPVTSPTYTIVNEYLSGRMPLFHFDMYRLGSAEELFDIGWEDYLCRGGVCAVEWSENVEEALDDAIRVEIRTDPTQMNRRQIVIDGGERFADFSL